jgi:glycerophosphoryl diester phosphodiesterase
LKSVQALRPNLKGMPEAVSAATLEKLLTGMNLRVVAFDASDFTDDVIQVAKRAGVEIYVDRLGAADNVSHWQDAIDRGANGIQTDHPAELVEYLRSRSLHK